MVGSQKKESYTYEFISNQGFSLVEDSELVLDVISFLSINVKRSWKQIYTQWHLLETYLSKLILVVCDILRVF